VTPIKTAHGLSGRKSPLSSSNSSRAIGTGRRVVAAEIAEGYLVCEGRAAGAGHIPPASGWAGEIESRRRHVAATNRARRGFVRSKSSMFVGPTTTHVSNQPMGALTTH